MMKSDICNGLGRNWQVGKTELDFVKGNLNPAIYYNEIVKFYIIFLVQDR